MKNEKRLIAGALTLLIAGLVGIAAMYYVVATEPSRHDFSAEYMINPNPEEPEPPETETATNTKPALAVFKKPCPDFNEPSADQFNMGWTVYSRPDLCFSLAYPPGWGTIENERGVRVMRLENFKKTSYDQDTFYAVVGVYLMSLDEIMDGLFSQADEKALAAALAIGNRYCYDYTTPASQYTDCHQAGMSGNYYTVQHTTNSYKVDIDLIKQIEATVKVW